jgi:predicted dehydrogenase
MALRWAIFGTGSIASKFISGMKYAEGSRAELIASRSLSRAQTMAKAFGVARAVEGYAAAARAGDYDVAYITTPAALHADHAVACLEAGVPVLIEKPFAAHAQDAKRIADAARASGTFCMEGMWTRFNPAARRLKQLVAEGALGEVRQIHGEFCASNAVDPASSSFDPARGGGALLQYGVYPLSLARWMLGAPQAIHALGQIGETGVDEDVAITMSFAGGAVATFNTSLRAGGGNGLSVSGTLGSAEFMGPVFRPYGLRRTAATPRKLPKPGANLGRKALLRENGLLQKLAQLQGLRSAGGKVERHLFAGNGCHYQMDEVARCLAAGLSESPEMPLDESIAVMETVDHIRQLMGKLGQ